ncbi:MAG: UDP-N-acetyl glucosamine 2-epimerase, partial [Rhodothermia bacterium]
MPIRVCIVVGARPQFIKAAELIHGGGRDELDYTLVHTGQHYDPRLSDIFFDELDIPAPQVNLDAGSGSHGRQTGEIMSRFERYLLDAGLPDWLVVFGDTNSTLAAAVTAAKLGVPVAHVEAGLRSFDRTMPEELNRVVTDRISDLLFCPSDLAVANLANEGIVGGVHNTGDIMFDSVVRHNPAITERARQISSRMGPDPWVLATIHRAANTDRTDRLDAVLSCLEAAEMPVVWPVHPRARTRLEANGAKVPDNVHLIDPMGYLTMLAHIGAASCILTDS